MEFTFMKHAQISLSVFAFMFVAVQKYWKWNNLAPFDHSLTLCFLFKNKKQKKQKKIDQNF